MKQKQPKSNVHKYDLVNPKSSGVKPSLPPPPFIPPEKTKVLKSREMDEKHDRHVWVKRWLADLCDHGHKPDECIHCLLEKYETAMTGWDGYGWKDGEYVDCLQDYFDDAMRRDDETTKTD